MGEDDSAAAAAAAPEVAAAAAADAVADSASASASASAPASASAAAAAAGGDEGNNGGGKKKKRPKILLDEKRLQAAADAAAAGAASGAASFVDKHGASLLGAVATLLAWLLGTFGLPGWLTLWPLGFAVLAVQSRRDARLWSRRGEVLAADLAERERVAAREHTESAIWLNDFVAKCWPHTHGFLSQLVQDQLRGQIDGMLGRHDDDDDDDNDNDKDKDKDNDKDKAAATTDDDAAAAADASTASTDAAAADDKKADDTKDGDEKDAATKDGDDDDDKKKDSPAKDDDGKEKKNKRVLPDWIEDIELTSLNFGKTAPIFTLMKSERSTEDNLDGKIHDIPPELRALMKRAKLGADSGVDAADAAAAAAVAKQSGAAGNDKRNSLFGTVSGMVTDGASTLVAAADARGADPNRVAAAAKARAKASKLEGMGARLPLYQLDIGFEFLSEIRAVASIVIGTKFFHFTVPIAIRDIEASGRLKLAMQLTDQSPFIKEMRVQLVSPKVDVAVRPLMAFDLIRFVPGLHGLVHGAVTDALQNLDLRIPLVPDDDSAAVAPSASLKRRHKKKKGKKGGKSRSFRTSLHLGGGGGDDDDDGKKEKKAAADSDSDSDSDSSSGEEGDDVQGTLQVKVISARGIPAMDRNGYSDPYCIVKVGGSEEKTSVKKKTLTPRWDESFEFVARSGAGQRMINIDCFDWDRVGGDDFMGCAFLDTTDFKDDEKHDLWLPIKNRDRSSIPGAKRAQVRVEVTFFAE